MPYTCTRKLTVYCSVVSSSLVFDSAKGFDHTDFGILESFRVPSFPWKRRMPPPMPIVVHCFSVGFDPTAYWSFHLKAGVRGASMVPTTLTTLDGVGSNSWYQRGESMCTPGGIRLCITATMAR